MKLISAILISGLTVAVVFIGCYSGWLYEQNASLEHVLFHNADRIFELELEVRKTSRAEEDNIYGPLPSNIAYKADKAVQAATGNVSP